MKDRVRLKRIEGLIKIIIIFGITIGSIYLFKYAKLEHIRQLVLSYGSLAELAYVACWIILPIFLFPVPVIALTGGLMFGVLKGSLLTIVGAMINTTAMYYISKYLAKDFVERLVLKKVTGRLREKLLTENQYTLGLLFFIMRIMPIISFNLGNYLAGITNIKLWVHLIETFLGIIPGTLIFLNFGDKIFQPSSPAFIISAIVLLALIIVPLFFTRRYLGDLIGKSNNNNTDL